MLRSIMGVVGVRRSQSVVVGGIEVVVRVLGMRIRTCVGSVRMRGSVMPWGGNRWRDMSYLVDMG